MKWWVVLWVAGWVVSCSNQNQNPVGALNPSVAKGATPERFTVVKQSASFLLERDSKNDHVKLALKKSALKKELLLMGYMTRQPGMGRMSPGLSHALLTRVVKFERKDKQLILLESPEGHSTDKALVPTLLVGVFPILWENDDRIVCDFNAGFNRVYLASSLSGVENEYKAEYRWDDLANSYVDQVQLSDNDEAEIRQIAQVPIWSTDDKGHKQDERLESFEIKYLMQPYAPDSKFVKGGSYDSREFRFFETRPMLKEKKGTQVYPFKIDPTKPFVFAYSANMPKEYVEALGDALEYWNQALGKNVLSLIAAPEGVNAPSYQYNMIQWVDSEDSNLSYFQAHGDPRTGQVIRGHVFLSSGASGAGKKQTMKWAFNHSHSWNVAKDTGASDCELSTNPDLRSILASANEAKMSKEVLARVMLDYLRSDVVHEVGHLLGLRHNFAGNLIRQGYDVLKRSEIFKTYLKTGEIPDDVVPGTSVMDYYDFPESIIIGRRIQKRLPMLAHDKKAIDLLYFNKRSDSKVLFCTDEDLPLYADCGQFDAGSNPVEEAALRSVNRFKDIKYSAIEDFATAKVGKSGTRIESISIDPNDLGARFWKAQIHFVSKMFPNDKGEGPKGKLLQVRSKYPLPAGMYEDKIQAEEWELFRSEVTRLGGLGKVIPAFKREEIVKFWEGNFKELNKAPTFVAPTGEEFTFPDSEWKYVSQQINDAFENLPSYAAKMDAAMWSRIPSWWKAGRWKFNKELSVVLKERAEEYLFALSGKTVDAQVTFASKPGPATISKKVKLPVFAFTETARVSAVTLLAPGPGEAAGWARNERKELAEKLLDLMEKEMGTKLRGFEVSVAEVKTIDGKTDDDLEQLVEDWFSQNVDIVMKLRTIKGLK